MTRKEWRSKNGAPRKRAHTKKWRTKNGAHEKMTHKKWYNKMKKAKLTQKNDNYLPGLNKLNKDLPGEESGGRTANPKERYPRAAL